MKVELVKVVVVFRDFEEEQFLQNFRVNYDESHIALFVHFKIFFVLKLNINS